MLIEKLAELRNKLLEAARLAEEMIDNSIKSLVNRDPQLAQRVIEEQEDLMNHLEIEIEDMGINLLTLFQPMAKDLRTLIMIIKINNDLERIGDHAVNIAERAQKLMGQPPVKPLIDLPRMASKSMQMLKDSLDAFINEAPSLARQVCERDDEVDALCDQVVRELITYMMADPATIDRALNLILIARDLERVADLATNIGEDVIYIEESKVIKHHIEEQTQGLESP